MENAKINMDKAESAIKENQQVIKNAVADTNAIIFKEIKATTKSVKEYAYEYKAITNDVNKMAKEYRQESNRLMSERLKSNEDGI